ncbi:hypothetical protein CF641_37290 [Burkholderia pseudomallei]|uniref:hypothetical protein n=1 Tax=Burkholderia pseudomallei TaxID=28450 RepID=UPI000CCDED50|nr:hypothetical protein [Burkholderia pseudomallei]PNW89739.1 hypothetical protein CF641_37290 [Burkholderia pseudomallei]
MTASGIRPGAARDASRTGRGGALVAVAVAALGVAASYGVARLVLQHEPRDAVRRGNAQRGHGDGDERAAPTGTGRIARRARADPAGGHAFIPMLRYACLLHTHKHADYHLRVRVWCLVTNENNRAYY